VFTHTRAKRFSCAHCSDCFTFCDQLKRHLLRSHNEGTWRDCHICQKKFVCREELKSHLIRHEGVKSYVCDACPRCFYRPSELRNHQQAHSDIRRFACGLCARPFKCKNSVLLHYPGCAKRLIYFWMVLSICLKYLRRLRHAASCARCDKTVSSHYIGSYDILII